MSSLPKQPRPDILLTGGDAIRTKETFRDGWVHTGDEVMFNKDGDMFIVDRLKAGQSPLAMP